MKILFVRFSSLGDIILTTGVMNYLKQQHPEAEIDVFTYTQFKEVFHNLPFVNRVITHSKSKGIIDFFNIIQKETDEYDYIFDLHGKVKSKFLKFHTQAEFFSYKKDSKARRDFVKKRKENDRLNIHVVEKYFEPVAEAFNIEMPDAEKLRPILSSDVPVNEKHVFIHPFASKMTKSYPMAEELAIELMEKGFTPVFGGDGDAPKLNGIIDKTGKTSLRNLFDTISSCEYAVSTDSGPLHAAYALNKPTVALFGSTTRHFGFYPDFRNVSVLEDNSLECRPCHIHGLDSCPRHHFQCMHSLLPSMIADMLAHPQG
jgi:ADP-heptose:LPS heptosyltransferase